MPFLVSEVTTRAAEVYLNDRSRTRWTDAVLLPVLKDAWDKLQTSLLSDGIRIMDEESVKIDVPANTVLLNGLAGFPADFIYPVAIYEKADGAADTEYMLMTEEYWNPVNEAINQEIVFWAWREDGVKVRPASVARDIKLLYKKSLVDAAATNTDLLVLPVLYRSYLSAKVAALASMFDGENSERAATCEGIAEQELEKILNIYTKKQQSMGVRRRPFDSRSY
jgi:hypothetical protein